MQAFLGTEPLNEIRRSKKNYKRKVSFMYQPFVYLLATKCL